MAERRSRDSDYVVVTGRKPKVVRSYYVDSDDDNDLQPTTVTRRVIRKKPSKEKPTAAVETNNGELDDGKQANESTDVRIFCSFYLNFYKEFCIAWNQSTQYY